jgi:hypothetical protein
MKATISVRVEHDMQETLKATAKRSKVSVSSLVRNLLNDELSKKTILERCGHVIGKLDLPVPSESWRKSIHERNWR